MHNAAFAAAGLDWQYELMDVPPAELPAAVERLRAPEVAGANVTIPHKQGVMERLDGLDADALRAHAVNTVVHDGNRLLGSNTDVDGIRAAISEVGLRPVGANAVILGGGGSARAAAVALDGAHLTFVSRHPDADDLPGRVIGWSDRAMPGLVRSRRGLAGRRRSMPCATLCSRERNHHPVFDRMGARRWSCRVVRPLGFREAGSHGRA